MGKISSDIHLTRWANALELTTYEDVVVIEEEGLSMGITVGEQAGVCNVSLAVEPLEWDDETADIFFDTFWGLGKPSYNKESGFVTVAVDGAKPEQRFNHIIEISKRFPRALTYAGVLPRYHCYSCGQDGCDNAVCRSGRIYPAHKVCVGRDSDSLSRTVRIVRKNFLFAVIACFFGAMFSTMFTFVIVIRSGILADTLYLLLPFCAAVAYRGAQGHEGPAMYATVSISSILATLITLMGMMYLSHVIAWEYFMDFGAFLKLLLAPEAMGQLIQVVTRSLLYTVFGLAITFYIVLKTKNSRSSRTRPDFTAFRHPVVISDKLLKIQERKRGESAE